MKNVMCSLLSLTLLMLISTIHTEAQVKLYKSSDFTGESISMEDTWSAASDMSWNDAINSIQIPRGWTIVVYDHSESNPNGRSLTLTEDWVADASWQNQISNISMVAKTGPGLVAVNNTLMAGQSLNAGEKLFSENGKFMLRMQEEDGNLCIYRAEDGKQAGFVWCSMAYGFKDAKLVLQEDGNLVVYDGDGGAKFNSETMSYFDPKWGTTDWKPVKLMITNEGKLNLFNAADRVVWTN